MVVVFIFFLDFVVVVILHVAVVVEQHIVEVDFFFVEDDFLKDLDFVEVDFDLDFDFGMTVLERLEVVEECDFDDIGILEDRGVDIAEDFIEGMEDIIEAGADQGTPKEGSAELDACIDDTGTED